MNLIKKIFPGYKTKAELRNEIKELKLIRNMTLPTMKLPISAEYMLETTVARTKIDPDRTYPIEDAKYCAKKMLFELIDPRIEISVSGKKEGCQWLEARIKVGVKK